MLQQSTAISKGRRSATGCIGCRLRRKKCSEEKPHCSNCLRNAILCTWPEAGNKEHAQLLRRTNPTRGRSRSPRSSRTMVDSRVGGSESVAYADSTEDEGNLQRTLVEILGSLQRSIDLDLLSSRGPTRAPESRGLFHHYVHRTNKVMAVCQGNKNPFLAELIPMAMSNDLILHALLALSGVHQADLAGAPVDKLTWVHYGQAIQGQKFGLTLMAQGDKEPLVPLLVTAIILCATETFRFSAGTQALSHLKAVRVLLHEASSLSNSQLGPETRAFLNERYAYIMTLAHISMGQESDQWVQDDIAQLFPTSQAEPEIHMISGCVHELFGLVPMVSVVARRTRDELQQGIGLGEAVIECWRLRSIISSWRPRSDDEVYRLCGQLYQQTLLVYLESALESEPGRPSTHGSGLSLTEKTLDGFIHFLGKVPVDSPISTSMCWPLAIFGSCARSIEHRNAISRRLEELSLMYATQSVRDTQRLLEMIWEQEDPDMASPLCFADVMKKEGMTVLFF
ncbi:C6 transcription factor [Colletotrichum kahawae]|uniref:C6 transcription factor n=1 Tax=Colletotrichum kahawae TaxID=34407 RepID=A0AAD9YK58_COLKA|nr:C6 transcription factor [Colletotrichum kahawae]